jgi:hypothetical protein
MCKFSRISYNGSHVNNWSSYELTSPVSQLLSAFGYVFLWLSWSPELAASVQLEVMLTVHQLGLRRGKDSSEQVLHRPH